MSIIMMKLVVLEALRYKSISFLKRYKFYHNPHAHKCIYIHNIKTTAPNYYNNKIIELNVIAV